MKPIAWAAGLAAVGLLGTAVYVMQREPEVEAVAEHDSDATEVSGSPASPRFAGDRLRGRSDRDHAARRKPTPAVGDHRGAVPAEPPTRPAGRPSLDEANDAHGGEIPPGAERTGTYAVTPPPGPGADLEWLHDADEESQREQALDALSMYVEAGAAEELAPVLDSLRSPDPDQRIKAIRQLADMSDSAFLPVFDALSHDEDPQVRAEVARAMERMQDQAG